MRKKEPWEHFKNLKVEKDEDDPYLAFSDDPRKVELYNKILLKEAKK